MDTLRVVLIIIGVLILIGIYWVSRRKQGELRDMTSEMADKRPLFSDKIPFTLPPADERAKKAEPDNLPQELSQLSGIISREREVKSPKERPQQPSPVSPKASPSVGPNATPQKASVKKVIKDPALADIPAMPQTQAAPHATPSVPHQEARAKPPAKIVVLNIMAPAGQCFTGPAIMEALQAVGMEYGEMHIFHRLTPLREPRVPRTPGAGQVRTNAAGKRLTIFSLANMLEPGIFDINQMESFSSTGLTLFMQLPTPIEGMVAYEDMLNTAQQLAVTLGGEMCDEKRNILTLQTIEHTREQLREFNYQQLLARKRAEQE